MAKATEGGKQLTKSSLRNEEHKKPKRGLSYSNREKEERGGDFYETFGGEAKRNSVLILGEEKLLKRDF